MTGAVLDVIIAHKPTKVTKYLDSLQIDYKTHKYRYVEKGGTSRSSQVLNIDEHFVIKTLVFQDKQTAECFIMLQHGDCQVNTTSLANAMQAKKVFAAAPQEAEKWTGYKVGGTSPFCLANKMKIFAEFSIFEDPNQEIVLNGGHRGFLIAVKAQNLQALLKPTLVKASNPK